MFYLTCSIAMANRQNNRLRQREIRLYRKYAVNPRDDAKFLHCNFFQNEPT